MRKISDIASMLMIALAVVIAIAQGANGSAVGCLAFASVAYMLFDTYKLERD